jgi:multidrug efflux pump subunit AcrA (membrane-fusion protein)
MYRDDYLRYARMFLTDGPKSRETEAPVRIRLADETLWTRTGKMDFVDNQLNPRSGTLRGRAVLQNKDELLTPGVFGRLQLFGGESDALLIPDSAVLSDQARKIVFALGPGNVVRPALVTLGPIVDGLRVIRGTA